MTGEEISIAFAYIVSYFYLTLNEASFRKRKNYSTESLKRQVSGDRKPRFAWRFLFGAGGCQASELKMW
jgi:hypothetical protein